MGKMREGSEKYYTIGQLSHMLGIPVSTLRFYDTKKLLVPEKRDENSNYRYYAESQIFDALNLIQLKHLGIPLLDIKKMLNNERIEKLKQSLKRSMEECEIIIQRTQARYSAAEQLYRQLDFSTEILAGEEANQNTQVVAIRYVPEVTIVSQRVQVKNFDLEPSLQALANIFNISDKENLRIAGSFHMLFLNHTPERFQSGDFEALCFFPIQPTESLHAAVKGFGGFWSVNTLHIGSYETLTPCYQQLLAEIEKRGLTIAGDPFEEYIINNYHDDDDENFITRVSFPIQHTDQLD